MSIFDRLVQELECVILLWLCILQAMIELAKLVAVDIAAVQTCFIHLYL